MNSNTSTFGMALICSQDGVISKVLFNGLGIAESELLGKPFPILMAESSFAKALSFLVELKIKQTIFDWEFDLHLGEKKILVHCFGLMLENNLLIMAGQTRSALKVLFEELMHINNDQANLLRTATKGQATSSYAAPEHEIGLYNELSRLNNELVTLQRELAKKNNELEHLYEKVQKLSITDDLTHLYNRRGFFEIGKREFERVKRFGGTLSAIMFDLDHFKQVNDSYGHDTGDRVLEEVAERCDQSLRKLDVIGRYGGEEFSILLPETKVIFAHEVAKRLRRIIADKPISTQQGSVTITISLGVAGLTSDTLELADLLRLADQELYRAKESGRNRICVAEDQRGE
jgi:diguanylate cyclase (GGDEF)-like protein